MYSILIVLLLLVVFYKLFTLREGFYHSINPCSDNNTPYIKYGNMYVCFNNKNRVEDTLQVFYGNSKDCYIDPKKTTMNLYDVNGELSDTITEPGTKVCKPYKVNIVAS
jgi:hypothetical protein